MPLYVNHTHPFPAQQSDTKSAECISRNRVYPAPHEFAAYFGFSKQILRNPVHHVSVISILQHVCVCRRTDSLSQLYERTSVTTELQCALAAFPHNRMHTPEIAVSSQQNLSPNQLNVYVFLSHTSVCTHALLHRYVRFQQSSRRHYYNRSSSPASGGH